MKSQARAGNYNFERAPTSLDGGVPTVPARPVQVKPPAPPGSDPCTGTGVRPPSAPDAAAIDEFLQRLARAVQQFHTYPSTSPLCQTAVDAAHRALAQFEHHDQISFRVTPHEVIVDDAPCGRGGIVEHEIARRLHAASVAEVTVDRAVTPREVARFCNDLVSCDDRSRPRAPLSELLSEHGVDRITLRTAYRPEVIEVGAPASAVAGLIVQQQQRREELFASGGAVNHLYPPDKGWVRVDPSSPLASVSLVDLALLAADPPALATMLLRLTDGESPETMTDEDALAQKFGDVATLFAALDPRVARVMFSKLSRAVLDLSPDRRQSLLRRTILPGLLDGRMEGGVLRDFPDVDLAESLCLLLDLETAAPEVVTTAFARLDLPAERQAAILPLVENRLQGRADGAPADTSVDAHARKLLRVDGGKARSFAEFAAFDLAVDQHTTDLLQQIRDGIAGSDTVADQLDCLFKLIRLEPNPDVVQRFFGRAATLLEELERVERWPLVGAWLAACRELCAALAETRPDVAEAIATRLAGLCTAQLAARIVTLAARDAEGRLAAGPIVRALGEAIVPSLLALAQMHARDADATRKAAIAMLCDNAALVAPALVALIGAADAETTRTIVRVLGLAGAGHESALAPQLASRDEQTVRETLRSLARIGTPQAAALVSAEIARNHGWLGSAAEETLWRFPLPEAQRHAATLLARRDFVLKHPKLATRLLDRAAQAGTAPLKPVLPSLLPLRYRFWNPALVRLARKARALAQS